MDMSREEMVQKLKDAELYEDGMADHELKDLVHALSDSIETAEHEETFRELQLKYDPEDALDDDWIVDKSSPLNLNDVPKNNSTPNKTPATITKQSSEYLFNCLDKDENSLPESDSRKMLNGLNNDTDTSFSSDEKDSSSPSTKQSYKRKLVQKNVLNNKEMLDISLDGSKKIKLDTSKHTRTYEKRNKVLDSEGYKSDYDSDISPTRKIYQTRSQQMIMLATTPKENKAKTFNSKLMTRLKEIGNETTKTKIDQNLTISPINNTKPINKDFNLNIIKNSNVIMTKTLRSGSTIRSYEPKEQKSSLPLSKYATTDKEIEGLLEEENSSEYQDSEISYNHTSKLNSSELFDEVKSGGKIWMDKFPLQPFVKEKSTMLRESFEPIPSTSRKVTDETISLRDCKRKRDESPDIIPPAVRVNVSIHSPPRNTGKEKQILKRGRSRNSGEWSYKNVKIEYDKIQSEDEYRNDIRSAYTSTSSSKATSTCPICQKDFSRSFIENHAATCGEK